MNLLCEKRKTHFAYLPKCAVESLILLILKENQENIKSAGYIWDRLHTIKSHNINKNYNYLVISRNPYNRLVSGYIDKFLTGNFSLLPFCKNVMKYYEREMNDNRRISFQELVEYLQKQNIDNIDGHFASQISLINIDSNPELFKLEDINNIKDKLKLIGFENTLENYRKIYLYGWQKENIKEAYKLHYKDYYIFDELRGYKPGYIDENGNNGIMPYYDNFYNEELRKKVYEIYKKDFKYFNYEK